MNLRLAFFVGVLLSGCATAEPQEAAPPEPTRTPVSLKQCLTGLSTLERPTPRQSVTACKDVWRNPKCAAAWQDALEISIELRPQHIITSCRDAYCPDLKSSPALCSMTGPVELSDHRGLWLENWGEFNRVVLAHDLEMAPEVELAAFSKTLLILVALAK